MTKLRIISTLIFLLSLFSLKANRIDAHYAIVSDGYNFWFATPDDLSSSKPLIIFLHGKSLCGSDLSKVKKYGTIDAIEKGRNIDAYVMAPQNPGGAWEPRKIMNIVDWAIRKYRIDPNRIYVLGMSLGGHGTLDFVAAYPDKVAAAMALCGGNIYKDPANLNLVPLWIVHGMADEAISISRSDELVKNMQKSNAATPRLRYDRVPGLNHSRAARFFYLADTYRWLFQHSLKDRNRPIALTYTISPQLLENAYSDLAMNKSAVTAGSVYSNACYSVPSPVIIPDANRTTAPKKATATRRSNYHNNVQPHLSSRRTIVRRAQQNQKATKTSGKKRKVRVAL